MRFLVTILVLFCSVLTARAGQSAALERGTAITDPLGLRELDRGRLGLGGVVLPIRASSTPLTNSQVFALPSMAPVRKALDDEFDRYVARHKASHPNETIGVGTSFDFQLFDRKLLYSRDSRFVLAGFVNPLGRAYPCPAHPGEKKLIYPLSRTRAPATGAESTPPRPPIAPHVLP